MIETGHGHGHSRRRDHRRHPALLSTCAMLAPQKRVVLQNCGIIDPNNIFHYIARGGYRA